MARSANYTYDPTTGKWTKSDVSENNPTTDSNTKDASGESDNNLTSSTSDKNTSTGSVEKKYNEIEVNTLIGTLNFIVNQETIKLRAGDTVKLQGLGKYLSGDYYVQDVYRNIGSNGYEHSATLIKTNFGKSLKIKSSGNSKTDEKKSSSTENANSAKRTHTVKKGESLWKISKQYYGEGSQYNRIYDANTETVANPSLIYVGQVLIIP